MKDLTKILCSYLPHDLMCIVPHKHGVIKNPRKLTAKNIDFADRWKPILRPISQLTKPIKEGGKEFVPVFELDKYLTFSEGGFINKMNPRIEFISGYLEFVPFHACIDISNKLHEWHFDLYSLIESNMAISIEDLQYNPYE